MKLLNIASNLKHSNRTSMKIKSFTFNPFMENTYVLYANGRGAIVDPGCYEPAEEQMLSEFIEKEGLKITQILNTHGHIDHVLGNTFAKKKYAVPLSIGEHDVEVFKAVEAYAPNYGFHNYQAAEIDHLIKEGDEIEIGGEKLTTLFVPGHSPGHIAFYREDDNLLVGGDVLFRESVGRTDLPGGDTDTLMKSIETQFYTLPDDTQVYSGHGEPTTIGHEKQYNPFCRA